MFPLPSIDSEYATVLLTYVLCNELFCVSMCHSVQFLKTEQCQHFNGHYCSCQCWLQHFYRQISWKYQNIQQNSTKELAQSLCNTVAFSFLFFFLKSKKMTIYFDSSSVLFKKRSFIITFSYAWGKKPNTQVKKRNCAQSKKMRHLLYIFFFIPILGFAGRYHITFLFCFLFHATQ